MVSYEDRKNMTFEQAEGAHPLPEPLALGELSDEFRARLWVLLYRQIFANDSSPDLGGPWRPILLDYQVYHQLIPVDEAATDKRRITNMLKPAILYGDYTETLGLVQYILRHKRSRPDIFDPLKRLVNNSNIPYGVVEEGTPTIVPRVTEEEGHAVQAAIGNTARYKLYGAHQHLIQSAEELNSENYAGSVRESVHAIESVAKQISADANAELGPALSKLAEHTKIHGALKNGFKNIYGYTSNENGIRHALLDQDVQVDQHDAVFMIGACASFVTYLINKADDSGLLEQG